MVEKAASRIGQHAGEIASAVDDAVQVTAKVDAQLGASREKVEPALSVVNDLIQLVESMASSLCGGQRTLDEVARG